MGNSQASSFQAKRGGEQSEENQFVCLFDIFRTCVHLHLQKNEYESIATVGESGVWLRADFQSGSRVLKKVF